MTTDLSTNEQKTIALAGIFQAMSLVQSLARKGFADHQAKQSAMVSILKIDVASTEQVYGSLNGVEQGLKLLADGALSSTETNNIEVFRYVMTLIHLHNQLAKDQQRYSAFGDAISSAATKHAVSDDSDVDIDALVRDCSDIYREFISPLRPQLIVQGEENHLQQSGVPEQVRALLLAGIRSVVLWQQKGGSRIKLVWQRGQYQRSAISLLNL